MNFKTFRNPLLSSVQSVAFDFLRRKEASDDPNPRGKGASPDHDAMEAVSELLSAYQKAGKVVDVPADISPVLLDNSEISGIKGLTKETLKLVAELFWYAALGDKEKVQEISNDLDDAQLDPHWAEALTAYIEFFIVERGDIPYITAPNASNNVVQALPPNARIGLIADWGSGMDIAKQVMARMFEQKPDVILHLGDIYYAGTMQECRTNFLDILNAARATHAQANPGAKPVPAYTLTGNHDMYSGGIGYYQLIKELNPEAGFPGLAQPASFFSLQDAARKWNLQCMDTGLHAHDPLQLLDHKETYLEDSEVSWHTQLLDNFSGRTLLMSHYQAFSALDVIGNDGDKNIPFNNNLVSVFKPYFADKIAAWLWGHEHLLEVYESGYLGLSNGRCIGHGTIPVFLAQDPYTPFAADDPPKLLDIKTGDDGVAYNRGFAMLSLDDAAEKATIDYYQVANDAPSYPSSVVFTETV